MMRKEGKSKDTWWTARGWQVWGVDERTRPGRREQGLETGAESNVVEERIREADCDIFTVHVVCILHAGEIRKNSSVFVCRMSDCSD